MSMVLSESRGSSRLNALFEIGYTAETGVFPKEDGEKKIRFVICRHGSGTGQHRRGTENFPASLSVLLNFWIPLIDLYNFYFNFFFPLNRYFPGKKVSTWIGYEHILIHIVFPICFVIDDSDIARALSFKTLRNHAIVLLKIFTMDIIGQDDDIKFDDIGIKSC